VNKTFVALRKTSLIDYPGKISTVLFFPGCNLRCPWCHNPELVQGQIENGIPLDEVFRFLEKRKTVIEAVVLSGGEATLYHALPELISSIKKLNLLVKLDTNGTQPEMLMKLFQNHATKPDYIALDIKLPPERYIELIKHQSKDPSNNCSESRDFCKLLKKSADLISQSNIEHEFRSLILPNNYLTENDIESMSKLIDDAPWIFRAFVPGNCLDEAWNKFPATSPNEQHPIMQKVQSLKKHIFFHNCN
jgi:pyruvate formate lyase activating enzyme